ncbi:hypothetical protein IAT38_004889 [Cryptococcus sp. DSM 104549]
MNPSVSPPRDGILDDDALAPLKRNHACKQCKKRKTKCDGTRPTCAPCLRSHAHAVRSANRNGTTPPTLICTFAEPLDESPQEVEQARPAAVRAVSGTGTKRPATGQGHRPSKDEENEALKTRIAELEAQLAGLTPQSLRSEDPPSSTGPRRPSTTSNLWPTDIGESIRANLNTFETFGGPPKHRSGLEEIGSNWGASIAMTGELNEPPKGVLPNELPSAWGLDELFLVPSNWPRGLPSPFLLEHLVETFFNYVPQTSRMLHRATLLMRIKLPPTSLNFPFPGLLHAICAAAAPHTAWVNNLSPHQVEAAVQHHMSAGLDLTSIEDFGLAQAELANRTVDLVTSACVMGGGELIFQVAQTCILLSDVYFAKGFPLKGWLIGGQPSRLIASIELLNRQPRSKPTKEPLMAPAKNSMEREERIITVWMAFVMDAGFSMNSSWAPSMNLDDIGLFLPTSVDEWQKLDGMLENPQDATSSDLFSAHPVPDSFVLVVKAAILMSKVSKWIREWQQRHIVPGDEFTGPSLQSFKDTMQDIETFVSSVPTALKNVFKMMDSTTTTGFDVNLLAIHILPSIAIIIMHEPFIEWEPSNPSLMASHKAYEAALGILHLIPSNLDVTMIFTPLMAFSMYTIGRTVAGFVKYALGNQAYGVAVRHRADLTTIQNLLDRYGQRHALGNSMSHFLENYVRLNNARPMSAQEMCQKSERAITYPRDQGGVYTVGPATTPEQFSFSTSSSSTANSMFSSGQSVQSCQSVTGCDSGSGSGVSPAVVTPSGGRKTNEPSPAGGPGPSSVASGCGVGEVMWEDWGRDAVRAMGADLPAFVNANSGPASGVGPGTTSSSNEQTGSSAQVADLLGGSDSLAGFYAAGQDINGGDLIGGFEGLSWRNRVQPGGQ